MSEKPIPFSGPMVRAALGGHKTVTRLVVKPQPPGNVFRITECGKQVDWGHADDDGDPIDQELIAPYSAGDTLWVRETFHSCPHCGGEGYGDPTYSYRAGGWYRPQSGVSDAADARVLPPKCAAHGWEPSIFMPREACRLRLKVTYMSIWRLQSITEVDARREGFTDRDQFHGHWDTINAKQGYGWDLNPWVWRVEFARAT